MLQVAMHFCTCFIRTVIVMHVKYFSLLIDHKSIHHAYYIVNFTRFVLHDSLFSQCIQELFSVLFVVTVLCMLNTVDECFHIY